MGTSPHADRQATQPACPIVLHTRKREIFVIFFAGCSCSVILKLWLVGVIVVTTVAAVVEPIRQFKVFKWFKWRLTQPQKCVG